MTKEVNMKIGILGSNGRMGKMISAEIRAGQYNATVGAEVDIDGDKTATFKSCHVIIDFTSPKAAVEHAELAVKYKKPLVIGTTGLGEKEEQALLAASKKTALLYAANMSLGVNLLLSLVEQAAEKLGEEFDIGIFEAHHKNKIDSPSGTALALCRAAKRKEGNIGFSVFRGGDIVGEHTVTFAGAGERIELSHKATDRAIFARGAIKAAIWLEGQPSGLYSMRDVLGL